MFVSTAKSRNVTTPKKLLSRVLEIRKRGEKNAKKKNGLSTFQQTIFQEQRRTTGDPNILRVLRSDRAAAENCSSPSRSKFQGLVVEWTKTKTNETKKEIYSEAHLSIRFSLVLFEFSRRRCGLDF